MRLEDNEDNMVEIINADINVHVSEKDKKCTIDIVANNDEELEKIVRMLRSERKLHIEFRENMRIT